MWSLELNPENYVELPAMQPDICIKCSSIDDREKLRLSIKVNGFRKNNIILERYEPIDLNLNFSLNITNAVLQERKVELNGSQLELKDIGMNIVNRDPGTAYHCPEGILFTYGDKNINQIFKNNSEKFLDTTKITPLILDYFNVKIPSYMSF